MTATVTTARSLLEAGDADFAALLSVWEEHRQCPLPMADLLLERGLTGPAQAALWAATTPMRRDFNTQQPSHPFPCLWHGVVSGRTWFTDDHDGFADGVPEGRLDPGDPDPHLRQWPTVRDALLGLLDEWKETP